MAQRKQRPLTDTQVIEKVLGELHRERSESPERRTPHDGFARMAIVVGDLRDAFSGIDGGIGDRALALRLAALAIRFVVEST